MNDRDNWDTWRKMEDNIKTYKNTDVMRSAGSGYCLVVENTTN
jgi:hypothetical protein